MPDHISYLELRARLAAECRARRWRPPSRRRLNELREADQLPPAIRVYEKGKRGCSWLYEASTVAAYVRAETLRRASGKRVRSWKLVASRERTQALCEWLAQPDLPVPRDIISDVFEGFARLWGQIASGVYSRVDRPVGPFEDSRLTGAHNAIDSMLNAAELTGASRPIAEALLRLLIFRDEDGNAENADLEEFLEPIRQQAGPFWHAGDGIIGLCRIVRDVPINELLTHPRALLEALSDDELRASIRMTVSLAAATERLSTVANVLVADVEKARANGWNDVGPDWCKPVAKGAAKIARFIKSEEAPWVLCAIALVNVWLVRRDPDGVQPGMALLTGIIAGLAAAIEQSRNVAEPCDPKQVAALKVLQGSDYGR